MAVCRPALEISIFVGFSMFEKEFYRWKFESGVWKFRQLHAGSTRTYIMACIQSFLFLVFLFSPSYKFEIFLISWGFSLAFVNFLSVSNKTNAIHFSRIYSEAEHNFKYLSFSSIESVSNLLFLFYRKFYNIPTIFNRRKSGMRLMKMQINLDL